jgi:hypothetical protein
VNHQPLALTELSGLGEEFGTAHEPPPLPFPTS